MINPFLKIADGRGDRSPELLDKRRSPVCLKFRCIFQPDAIVSHFIGKAMAIFADAESACCSLRKILNSEIRLADMRIVDQIARLAYPVLRNSHPELLPST
jgi:hypothetical protein